MRSKTLADESRENGITILRRLLRDAVEAIHEHDPTLPDCIEAVIDNAATLNNAGPALWAALRRLDIAGGDPGAILAEPSAYSL